VSGPMRFFHDPAAPLAEKNRIPLSLY